MSSWLLPEGYLSHQRKVQLQCAHATAPSLLFTRLFWRMLSTLQRLLGSASDTGWMARRSWRYDDIFENQWVSSDGSEYPLDWICLKHSLESIYLFTIGSTSWFEYKPPSFCLFRQWSKFFLSTGFTGPEGKEQHWIQARNLCWSLPQALREGCGVRVSDDRECMNTTSKFIHRIMFRWKAMF